jgi:hypothetical protein
MPTERPRSLELPDLSGLDNALTTNHLLNLAVAAPAFPPGPASGLATAMVRTTESALRAYERARLLLNRSVESNSLTAYLEGLSEMEVCLLSLYRAMRVAERLAVSPETMVDKNMLPSARQRNLLRRMRNAIDHIDKPMAAGEFGMGVNLFLFITEKTLTIHDGGGELVAKQTALGQWLRTLHGLATHLSREPAVLIPSV